MDPSLILRQSLNSEIDLFLSRVEGIYKDCGMDTVFLRSYFYHLGSSLIDNLLPRFSSDVVKTEKPSFLSDFLKSTLHNSVDKVTILASQRKKNNNFAAESSLSNGSLISDNSFNLFNPQSLIPNKKSSVKN